MGIGVAVLIIVVIAAIAGVFLLSSGGGSAFKKQFDVQFVDYSADSMRECNALLLIGDEQKSSSGGYDYYRYDLSSNPAMPAGRNDGYMEIKEQWGQFKAVTIHFDFEEATSTVISECARDSAVFSAIAAAMPTWRGENTCQEYGYDDAFDNWASCNFPNQYPFYETRNTFHDGKTMTVSLDTQTFLNVSIEQRR